MKNNRFLELRLVDQHQQPIDDEIIYFDARVFSKLTTLYFINNECHDLTTTEVFKKALEEAIKQKLKKDLADKEHNQL